MLLAAKVAECLFSLTQISEHAVQPLQLLLNKLAVVSDIAASAPGSCQAQEGKTRSHTLEALAKSKFPRPTHMSVCERTIIFEIDCSCSCFSDQLGQQCVLAMSGRASRVCHSLTSCCCLCWAVHHVFQGLMIRLPVVSGSLPTCWCLQGGSESAIQEWDANGEEGFDLIGCFRQRMPLPASAWMLWCTCASRTRCHYLVHHFYCANHHGGTHLDTAHSCSRIWIG